jgi:predicted RNase H-like nuclease (RuvC/YqgF family)
MAYEKAYEAEIQRLKGIIKEKDKKLEELKTKLKAWEEYTMKKSQHLI